MIWDLLLDPLKHWEQRRIDRPIKRLRRDDGMFYEYI